MTQEDHYQFKVCRNTGRSYIRSVGWGCRRDSSVDTRDYLVSMKNLIPTLTHLIKQKQCVCLMLPVCMDVESSAGVGAALRAQS